MPYDLDLSPNSSNEYRRIYFEFNKARLEGYFSEPLVISLYRNGVKAIGRSKKMYRWRGLYDLSPQNRTILVKANGVYVDPVVTPCRENLIVHSNTSKPVLVKLFSRFLTGHFQHHKFLRNKILWRFFVEAVSRYANLPNLFEATVEVNRSSRILDLSPDILIVGGGLAGLTAANLSSSLGLNVILVEESPWLGGRLRYDTIDVPGITIDRSEILNGLVRNLESRPNVKILLKTVFAGFFKDYAIAYSEDNATLYKIRSKAYILANGKIDLPCIFRNNDMPGVISASTILKMLNCYDVNPGKRALLLGYSEDSVRIGQQLKRAGVEVVIADNSDIHDRYSNPSLEVVDNLCEVRVAGGRSVEKAELYRRDGVREVLDIDFVVCSAFSNPDIKFAGQLNSKIIFIKDVGFIPIHNEFMELRDNVFIAGGATGSPYSILHSIEGEISALSSALKIGFKNLSGLLEEKVEEYLKKLREFNITWKEEVFKSYKSGYQARLDVPVSFKNIFISKPRRDAFICFCEDVTTEDIIRVVHLEEFKLLELVKRGLGICTGRCQGRLCMINASIYISHLYNLDPNRIGLTRIRSPGISLPIHVLELGEGA
ncbi:MAG: FAD-dependent oxidoreductase [Nitrososphaerota archaeon]